MNLATNQNLDTLIDQAVFNIFDTETTGNNKSGNDRPIEIAAVKWNLHEGFLEAPKSWLVDPQMPIHPSAIPIHGLFDSDVEGKPLLKDILPEFHEYMADSIAVAHNISFDLEMLPTLKENNPYRIDSLKLARKVFTIGEKGYKDQDLRSHQCQELRYWLNIDIDTMGLPAHRAASDILVTGEVFKEMIKRFLERTQSQTIGDLVNFIDAPVLIEKMPFGKLKDRLISEAVKEELKLKANYFAWLLKKVHSGEMNIDADLKYSIEYHLKQNDVDPVALLIEEPQKNWKDISAQARSKF